ncbi:hypothetical protein L228DRAFT_157890 [Xylona heveae TC161]|uniref:Uncharacterized protein n=1 Tax=Xylona heveae (strain CBS 132557 / TC161) TaxID=1328760 RepID=A0A165G3E0_XYLHT|nr:hypothetical protein L228DRAFT_157890 [Xylona heveae TC161]KZF21692.1 hypothetical protein L228DRAFT_157890 [Xylona heveae TC161]
MGTVSKYVNDIEEMDMIWIYYPRVYQVHGSRLKFVSRERKSEKIMRNSRKDKKRIRKDKKREEHGRVWKREEEERREEERVCEGEKKK